jgi:hypothetical protein
MAVRRAALARFSERAIRRGEPLATLEEVLVPLYLHHRYQVEAAVKAVAGQYYDYAMRGDGVEPLHWVPAAEQTAALDVVLRTLLPRELTLPATVLRLIPPRPPTYPSHRELFPRATGLVFDAVSPAVVAADLTVQLLLDEERAARLVEQHALDPALPGLDAVLDRLVAAAFDAPVAAGYEAEVARAVRRVVADRLMGLAFGADMSQARALAMRKLSQLADRPVNTGTEVADQAAQALIAQDIRRFLERPFDPTRLPTAPNAPPGSPIGDVVEFVDVP